MDEFLNAGLPKWPMHLVYGQPVSPEQAIEVIRRTDRFFQNGWGGNNRQWNRAVKNLLGIPDTDRNYEEPERTHEQRMSVYEQFQEWTEKWGVIHTEYIANWWISSAYIGGPHGWMHPSGLIWFNHNVGKWPSASNIYDEWKTLAEAFPFIKLDASLWSGEYVEDEITCVVGYKIRDGKVEVVAGSDETLYKDFDRTKEQLLMTEEQHENNMRAAIKRWDDPMREIGINQAMLEIWWRKAKDLGLIQKDIEAPAKLLE